MKRVKRHKIKEEKPETSTSYARSQEEHDLAYYIHDRVELMHQVFSLLKHKEIRSIAPSCVRGLSINDLQELCTEELLGISSKRLLSILDGAEPPSDTESSSPSASPELMETISLDSISSDEEILSQTSSKKPKKHKHRHSKQKKHKDKEKTKDKSKDNSKDKPEDDQSKATRAGLTVLELLELQARARAIRAQLQQEQANKKVSQTQPAAPESTHSSDNEVEIKEEPAEVVEISSEDDKPDVKELEKELTKRRTTAEITNEKHTEQNGDTGSNIIKRSSDLVITLPQQAPTRRIKLKRNNVTVAVTNSGPSNEVARVVNIAPEVTAEKTQKKQKKKDKKGKKSKTNAKDDKEGSDHDEITLQLSDTEKMDLLEGFHSKEYDNVTSGSEDSESSSSDSSSDDNEPIRSNGKEVDAKNHDNDVSSTNIDNKSNDVENSDVIDVNKSLSGNFEGNKAQEIEGDNVKTIETFELKTQNVGAKNVDNTEENIAVIAEVNAGVNRSKSDENNVVETPLEIKTVDDIPIIESPSSKKDGDRQVTSDKESPEGVKETPEAVNELANTTDVEINVNNKEIIDLDENTPLDKAEDVHTTNGKESDEDTNNKPMKIDKNIDILNSEPSTSKEIQKSDGEVSDKDSSDIEAFELKSEVVCISDDEGKCKSKKKHKKKEKKSKKGKKSKKTKSDFRESGDQNFYKETEVVSDEVKKTSPIPLDDDDDIYEVLELSDDSSCFEVEGTVLSKEPTAEEIEALSAKIDEINREEVVTDEQIRQHEREQKKREEVNNETIEENKEDAESVSWKDRYLDSKKVKRVLTTANILNALRKKNKELKIKLDESKKLEEELKAKKAEEDRLKELVQQKDEERLEEGSIDHYNTLQGSNKYVDPVADPTEKSKDEIQEKEDIAVTKEMKKDAKQLLKMYKKLLKYNDMNKPKDPNKKKKKKKD